MAAVSGHEGDGRERSLLDLLDVHEDLREQFARHRDLIVRLEFGPALQALEEFERHLVLHMQAEERYVLPLYEERVGHVPGGDPEFCKLEHQNLLKNLALVKEELRQVAKNPLSGPRQAQECLHGQHLFLELLDHHDLRERNTLYLYLNKRLSEDERTVLLRACGMDVSRDVAVVHAIDLPDENVQ